MSAAQVEASVGARAVINTAREASHRDAVRMVSITSGDGTGVPVRVADAREVVYWTRPIAAHDVPVIGVLWFADGRVETFTGYVLPP